MARKFSVDPKQVGDMAGRLMGLKREFDSLESFIDRYQEAVGHKGLGKKLGDFASNWSDLRDDIGKQLEEVAGYAAAAAEAYERAEQGLTKEYDKAAASLKGD